MTNRRIPVPEGKALRKHPKLSRPGYSIPKQNTASESSQCGFIRTTLDLDPVSLWQLLTRIRDPGLKDPLIGQHQKPLAVMIQPSRRTHPGAGEIVPQRGVPTVWIGEL